ncbi:hypothetical protein BHE74_00018325 [Ensete ventricosum]|nr:hypothetical protein BHE74_00018325 [Ensete ventricosum]
MKQRCIAIRYWFHGLFLPLLGSKGTRLPKFGSFSHPGHYRGRGRDFGLLKLGSLGCPGANKDEAEAIYLHNPGSWENLVRLLGFVKLRLLGSGHFRETYETCKKTFVEGCVPDETPPMTKLAFGDGDPDQDSEVFEHF